MNPSKNLDSNEFTQKVITAIDLIQSTENLVRSASEDEAYAYSSGFDDSKKEAEKITKDKNVMKHICPGLKVCSGEAIDIAKNITPVLVGLVLTNAVVMPLNPILFGWIALVIANGGITSLCSTFE